MNLTKLGIFVVMMAVYVSSLSAYSSNQDSMQIRNLLKNEALKSGSKLTQIIGPFISGQYAIATCIYGEAGGESVLKKSSKGVWKEIDGTGGAYTKDYLIKDLHIPKKDVDSMYSQQEAYWKKKGSK